MDRAPRTKETLSDFHEWCRVTRHPLLFRGLTGSQRTPEFWGVTPIDQENFIDIMCNNYLDDQIISKLHQTNLVKNFLDIEVINQFIIKPHIPEKEEKINKITEISKELEEKIT